MLLISLPCRLSHALDLTDALLQVLTGVLVFTRSYLLAHFGITASLKVHKDLLESVFAAPMSWFDTTPIGRVISRFSKDIFNIDTELTNFLDFAIFMVLSVLMTMVMIVSYGSSLVETRLGEVIV